VELGSFISDTPKKVDFEIGAKNALVPHADLAPTKLTPRTRYGFNIRSAFSKSLKS